MFRARSILMGIYFFGSIAQGDILENLQSIANKPLHERTFEEFRYIVNLQESQAFMNYIKHGHLYVEQSLLNTLAKQYGIEATLILDNGIRYCDPVQLQAKLAVLEKEKQELINKEKTKEIIADAQEYQKKLAIAMPTWLTPFFYKITGSEDKSFVYAVSLVNNAVAFYNSHCSEVMKNDTSLSPEQKELCKECQKVRQEAEKVIQYFNIVTAIPFKDNEQSN